MKDIRTPCIQGSLTRTLRLTEIGEFRISRRAAELYSVIIESSGAWGRVKVTDLDGRMLFYQPSTFTGSFYLMAGSNGLIVNIQAATPPIITITWREENGEVI
jgi:hypothetical protein